MWKSKSAREHRAVLAARAQLPGGECRGTPFYILIVEIEPPVCHVTERATSVRTAGVRGKRSRRIIVGKWKRSGREDRSRESERARETRTIDRGRSNDRIRGTTEGGPRGEPRNDRYEDGITHGPLASTW